MLGFLLVAGFVLIAVVVTVGKWIIGRQEIKLNKEDRYKIRQVRDTDIDDIKEIASSVYGGKDYIYVKFDELYTDPDLYFFVLYDKYTNNKVVATQLSSIIDDNTTIWGEGLRVHPKWRRNGLATMITLHAIDFILNDNHLKSKHKNKIDKVRIATTTSIATDGSIQLHVNKLGFNIVEQWQWKIIQFCN